MNATDALDNLSELYARRDLLCADINAQIAELEAHRSILSLSVDDEIKEAEEAIKAAVLANGASIKGERLQAVYAQGRTTWDTKGLDGFMVAHPEINVFRSVGQPSVSIRKGGTE